MPRLRQRTDPPAALTRESVAERRHNPMDLMYRRLLPTAGPLAGRVCEVVMVHRWEKAWIKPVVGDGEAVLMTWLDAAHAVLDHETGTTTPGPAPTPEPEVFEARPKAKARTRRTKPKTNA